MFAVLRYLVCGNMSWKPQEAARFVQATVTKNATDKVAYQSQKFTSHISGGWEVQDQRTSTAFGVWGGLLPQEHMSSQYKLTGRKNEGSPSSLYDKGKNTIHEGSTATAQSPLQSPTSKPQHIRHLGSNICTWGGGRAQRKGHSRRQYKYNIKGFFFQLWPDKLRSSYLFSSLLSVKEFGDQRGPTWEWCHLSRATLQTGRSFIKKIAQRTTTPLEYGCQNPYSFRSRVKAVIGRRKDIST